MEPPKYLNSMDDPEKYEFAQGGAAGGLEPDRKMKLPGTISPEAAGQVLKQVGRVLAAMDLELSLAGHAAERLAGAHELGIFLHARAEAVVASGWQVLGAGQTGPGEPRAVVAVRREIAKE